MFNLYLKGFQMKNTFNAVLLATVTGVCSALAAIPALAQQQVLNLYSSRHYQTDEALYANFEKATGIKVGLLINFGKHKVGFKRLVF